jgi:hypothetical protein
MDSSMFVKDSSLFNNERERDRLIERGKSKEVER